MLVLQKPDAALQAGMHIYMDYGGILKLMESEQLWKNNADAFLRMI